MDKLRVFILPTLLATGAYLSTLGYPAMLTVMLILYGFFSVMGFYAFTKLYDCKNGDKVDNHNKSVVQRSYLLIALVASINVSLLVFTNATITLTLYSLYLIAELAVKSKFKNAKVGENNIISGLEE